MRQLCHLRSQIALWRKIKRVHLQYRVVVLLTVEIGIIVTWRSNTIINIAPWLSRLSCIAGLRLTLKQWIAFSSIKKLSVKNRLTVLLRCVRLLHLEDIAWLLHLLSYCWILYALCLIIKRVTHIIYLAKVLFKWSTKGDEIVIDLVLYYFASRSDLLAFSDTLFPKT